MSLNIRASKQVKKEITIKNSLLLNTYKDKTPDEIRDLVASRGLNPIELLETVQELTIAVTYLLDKGLR